MDASIKRLKEKIKRFLMVLGESDVFTPILIILVTFLAFGLGRLSVLESEKPEIRLESIPSPTEALIVTKGVPPGTIAGAAVLANKTNQYVASKNGTKYYFSWCTGVSRIKEENKVWFSSAEEAKKAGYQPSSTCKGL